MKKKNIIIIVSIIIVLLMILGILLVISDDNISDASRFSKEYQTVEEDNVFVYRDVDEIIKILKNGTGVVYLGFPECPWCMEYVKYLNNIAKDNEVDKIYYYNILDIRNNNTYEYLEIVSILEEYLQYDDEGNKRVYVPAVVVIKKGEIIGFDDETAWDTKGYEDPKDYWTDSEISDLESRLGAMFNDLYNSFCTTDCN